jgi:glycosyltransferase involved in cell wall biosynthesis
MHVLIIPSWYPNTYAPVHGTFFREQVDALKDSNIQVGVIAPALRTLREFSFRNIFQNHGQITYDKENGVSVYRKHGWRPPKGGRLVKVMWLNYARKLFERYVSEHGLPDLIHAHCHIWAGFAAKQIHDQYGVPFVITEHFSGYFKGHMPGWLLNEVAVIAASASKVLAVSRALSKKLDSFIDTQSIIVIPNMVDVDFFSLPATRPPRSPLRFLFIGFLLKNKAVDVLISALSILVCEGHDVYLDVGGDGPERIRLEKLAEMNGVRNKVRFLGSLSRKDVRKAMWQTHVFVLPSYVETFGVVLIEAMATGLPVIATRCGGPEEIVDKQSGILVMPGDVAELVNAMKSIVNENSNYSSQDIRKNILNNYSCTGVTQNLIDIYREVIE